MYGKQKSTSTSLGKSYSSNKSGSSLSRDKSVSFEVQPGARIAPHSKLVTKSAGKSTPKNSHKFASNSPRNSGPKSPPKLTARRPAARSRGSVWSGLKTFASKMFKRRKLGDMFGMGSETISDYVHGDYYYDDGDYAYDDSDYVYDDYSDYDYDDYDMSYAGSSIDVQVSQVAPPDMAFADSQLNIIVSHNKSQSVPASDSDSKSDSENDLQIETDTKDDENTISHNARNRGKSI